MRVQMQPTMNLLEEALYLIRHEKISTNSYFVHLMSFIVLPIFMAVFHEYTLHFISFFIYK